MIVLAERDDFSTSVLRALGEAYPKFKRLSGMVVCGSHTEQNVDLKVEKIRQAREFGIPVLGICMGMHLMAIEYARNVMGFRKANSQEFSPRTSEPVVYGLGQRTTGIRMTGSGRMEQFWHSYAVDRKYLGDGWTVEETPRCVDLIRLKELPFYVGCQFHPEYLSSKGNTHPLISEFICACKSYAKT